MSNYQHFVFYSLWAGRIVRGGAITRILFFTHFWTGRIVGVSNYSLPNYSALELLGRNGKLCHLTYILSGFDSPKTL